mmetsp:Transcript_57103/g.121214  ORF Transcript_57103/g.121214 Transcript_57103/m.121214 type:complete len:317 (-) Transcript_57103:240-1190(-)
MLFSRSELKPLLHQVATNDPTLTSLHLCHKKITNKQLLQISDALQSNTSVTEIWLTNNQISDDSSGAGGAGSVGYFASVLESNTSVGEVYLGSNKIGAKGASSIANLLQHNNTITDIGLDDNKICDGGAKMMADALRHNDTLQTLKLQGNDIQTERTLESINALLKKNREAAKRRFEEEHPELKTHKLKKPEEKKKKKKSRSGDRKRSDDDKKKRSGDDKREDGRRRSGDDKRGDDGRRSGGSDGPSRKPQSAPRNGGDDNDATKNFLTDRKKTVEESKPNSGLASKLKTGLKLGGGGKEDAAEVKRKGMKSAAFV